MSFKEAAGPRKIDSKWGTIVVNSDYDVPLVAGLSENKKTLYVDRSVSLVTKIAGKLIDRTPFLLVHEMVEAEGEEKPNNEAYAQAHKKAEQEENKAVRAAGLSPQAYEESWRKDIARCAKKLHGHPHLPPDIIKKPYDHPHRKRANVALRQG